MNRQAVSAYLVNRHTCDHPECAEMRRLVRRFRALGKINLVNYTESQLALCPDARKVDDNGALNAPPTAQAARAVRR